MYILLSLYSKCFSIKRITGIMNDYGAKHNMVMSNIPGFLKPIHIDGNQISKFFCIATSMGTLNSSIVLFSIMDQLTCNISTDELQIENFDLFVDIFNRKIKELGIDHDE